MRSSTWMHRFGGWRRWIRRSRSRPRLSASTCRSKRTSSRRRGTWPPTENCRPVSPFWGARGGPPVRIIRGWVWEGVTESVRFRHKLSIVLVGLAVVPLVGAGLIVQALLARDQVRQVDAKLSAGAAGAAAAYRAQLLTARGLAGELAVRADVQRAFRSRDGSALDLQALGNGLPVALADRRGVFAGSEPTGQVWRTQAELSPASSGRRVIVTVPLDTTLLARVANASPVADGVSLALVVDGRTAATVGGSGGDVSGLVPGEPADGHIGEDSVRAQAVRVQGPDDTPALLVAEYPRGRIDDRIDAVRLKLLVPLALLAGIVAGLALLAADRISRAL